MGPEMDALRILVVEDNAVDAELVVRELERAGLMFSYSIAAGRSALELSLSKLPLPDIVLCDYNLPDIRGLEVIEIMRDHDPFIPVVIVTGSISEEVAVDCIKAGAADYVIKSNFTRLPLAVRYAIEHARLRREEANRNREVERARDFYMTLVDDFPNPVWRLDETGRCDYVNRAWLEFTGRRLEDELGDGWVNGVLPEDRRASGSLWRRHFRARVPFTIEYRLRHADGTHHAVVSHGRPMFDPADGHFAGFVGMCFDLDDVRRAEERERLLATAIDASAEAIVVTDREGVIEYVNPAYEKTSGYSLEELAGRKSSILKSGQQNDDFYGELWSTITSGRAWRGHLVNRRKDGTLYEEEASISPVFARDGSISNFVGVKKDMTRERDLETRLLQAQKLDAIGRVAGGVAHDFNNLLGVITGYADLLESTLDSAHPARRRLQQIRRATQSAAELTHQLLAFGRRQVLQPVPLDLNVLVIELTAMIRRLVPETIAIETSLASPAPLVVVDRSQIEQVIINLALNARDAMPRGGVIRIATARCGSGDGPMPVPAGDLACLEVTDTGVGIGADEMEHMFEPFYTTKREAKGTGLGLATVYGIVRQSGGEIAVESVPGSGSTFRIFLPLAPPGAIAPVGTFAAGPRVASERDSAFRILLVEDQPMLREMIHEGLEAVGCSVISASTGREALALASDAGEIDLLLTDVVMPGMSGRELAERIRENRPDLAVLFMSGYSSDVISKEGVLDQGIDLMNKPFTMDSLMERIRALLGRPGRVS
jgi:PAS domain S-box-containing protein